MPCVGSPSNSAISAWFQVARYNVHQPGDALCDPFLATILCLLIMISYPCPRHTFALSLLVACLIATNGRAATPTVTSPVAISFPESQPSNANVVDDSFLGLSIEESAFGYLCEFRLLKWLEVGAD